MKNTFKQVEILLAEDSTNNAELTIRTLKKHHLANDLWFIPANKSGAN